MSAAAGSQSGVPRPYEPGWLLPARALPYRGYSPAVIGPRASMQFDFYVLSMSGTSSPPPARASTSTEPRKEPADTKTLAERQRALADAHPEEYVVVLGDRVLVHTNDKGRAFSCFHEAWDDSSEQKPVVIPPAAIRERFRPVVRGRAIPESPRRPKR